MAPSRLSTPPNGAVFDFDADLDVDHSDFAGLQRLVIGP